MKTTNAFTEQLRQGKAQNNKIELIACLTKIQGLINEAESLYEDCDKKPIGSIKAAWRQVKAAAGKSESRLPVILANLKNFCDAEKKYLDAAVDISIYQVRVPKSLYKEGSMVFYEGKSGPALGVAAGGLGVLASLAIVLEVGLIAPAAADLYYSKGALFKGLAEVAGGSFNKAAAEFSKYGSAFKDPIASEDIGGVVTSSVSGESKDIEPVIKQNRNYAGKHGRDPDYETIYVIDGRNPEVIFEDGTGFGGKEGVKTGATIGFRKLEHALACAAARADGELWDPQIGFRKYQALAAEERTSTTAQVLSAIQPSQSAALISNAVDKKELAENTLAAPEPSAPRLAEVNLAAADAAALSAPPPVPPWDDEEEIAQQVAALPVPQAVKEAKLAEQVKDLPLANAAVSAPPKPSAPPAEQPAEIEKPSVVINTPRAGR